VSRKCKQESDSSVLGPDLEPRQEKQPDFANRSEGGEVSKIQRGARLGEETLSGDEIGES